MNISTHRFDQIEAHYMETGEVLDEQAVDELVNDEEACERIFMNEHDAFTAGLEAAKLVLAEEA